MENIRSAAAFTQHAVELVFRGQYGAALNFIEQALEANASYARAHAAKAICLAQLGEGARALPAADRAIALDPDVGVYFSIRAMCKSRLRDFFGAEADYEEALRLAPDDFKVYYNYACYWAERGDEEKCRKNLKAALDLTDASYAYVAPHDPDLARFHDRPWFRDLIAEVKLRLAGNARP